MVKHIDNSQHTKNAQGHITSSFSIRRFKDSSSAASSPSGGFVGVLEMFGSLSLLLLLDPAICAKESSTSRRSSKLWYCS